MNRGLVGQAIGQQNTRHSSTPRDRTLTVYQRQDSSKPLAHRAPAFPPPPLPSPSPPPPPPPFPTPLPSGLKQIPSLTPSLTPFPHTHPTPNPPSLPPYPLPFSIPPSPVHPLLQRPGSQTPTAHKRHVADSSAPRPPPPGPDLYRTHAARLGP